MNDGGGSGARCGGIKVRTDTAKLSNVAIASFVCIVIHSQTISIAYNLAL